MIVLRATAKLLQKLKPKIEESPAPSTGLFGDWYCNITTIQGHESILCVSQTTLLPIVLPARDLQRLPQYIREEIKSVLEKMGIKEDFIKEEISQMKEVLFAKTTSRQVLGSMNDFLNILNATPDFDSSLKDLTFELGDTPCGPLGMMSPFEKTAELLKSWEINRKSELPKLRLIKS